MHPRLAPFALAAIAVVSVGLAACSSDSGQAVSFTAKHDNILYEDAEGSLSNGAGETIHVGTNGQGQIRRGIIAFDVASNVPPDRSAKIASVRLTLNLSRESGETPESVSLHRVLKIWGEGASDAEGNEGGGVDATAGDATWVHASYDGDLWANPGGDFASEPSATLSIEGLGQHTWTSQKMVDDVRAWVENPSTDFGWLIKGNESSDGTVKRFDSKDNHAQTVRPVLVIEFE